MSRRRTYVPPAQRQPVVNAMDWTQLAEQHRPSSPSAMRVEIRRMAAGGLTPIDVADALRVPLTAVLEALQAPGALP